MVSLPFITSNKKKIAEFQAILAPISIEPYSQELTEIQSLDVVEVVQYKIVEASKILNKPCLVEDTGLYLDELQGFPGALVKFYLAAWGVEGIARLHGGKSAVAKTAIGYFDGNQVHIFVGTVMGTIADKPMPPDGFGWDPIFIPHATAPRTFAALSFEEKNQHSMRKQALERLKSHLQQYPLS